MKAEKRKYLNLIKTNPVVFGNLVGFLDLVTIHNEWLKSFLFAKEDQTLLAHRGSYKTTTLAVAIALLMILFPNKTIIFLRKTDTDVVEIILQVAKILHSSHFKLLAKILYNVDLILTKETTTEITETVLVIELTHKTPGEMATDYHFTARQNNYLQLLQDPQYEQLWAELLGGFAQGGGKLMNPDSTRTPTGTLQWPLPVAGTITSQFGHRVDPITGEVSSHTGTDIACAEGTPILAAANGTVTVANGLDSWGGSYGYYIQIDHGGGLETLYAHCSSVCVTTGQQVQAGEVIGYVGHTGRVTGNHLHLEVRIDGNRADVLRYFTL